MLLEKVVMFDMFEHVERVQTFSEDIIVSAEHMKFPFILHCFGSKIGMLKLLDSEICRKICTVLRWGVDVRQQNMKMFGE